VENDSGNDSEIERLAEAIRHYLVLHPDASDSLSGIQRWWLGNESRNLPQKSMEAALSRLVQCGAVERIERHGQEAIYRTLSTSTKPSQ
jgi:hypothetical protein